MSQYAFSFDVSRCSGCMACVVACQDQNDTIAFRHVTCYESGEYPSARISFFSLACQQCGDAPCLMACPTGAISRQKEGGIVLVDFDRCIGCHSCELACPFGAPRFLEEGKMAKCDLCHIRMDNGMKPACVLVCPTRALDVGPIEELSKKKAEKASIMFLKSLTSKPPRGA